MMDINLGGPGSGGCWFMTVSDGFALVPVAFSPEQAVEMARRINRHYGKGQDALLAGLAEIHDITKMGSGCQKLPKHGRSKIARIAKEAIAKGGAT